MSSVADPSTQEGTDEPSKAYIRCRKSVQESVKQSAEEGSTGTVDRTLTLEVLLPTGYKINKDKFGDDVTAFFTDSRVNTRFKGLAALSEHVQGAFDVALGRQGRQDLKGPAHTIWVHETWGANALADFKEQHHTDGVTCTVTNPSFFASLDWNSGGDA